MRTRLLAAVLIAFWPARSCLAGPAAGAEPMAFLLLDANARAVAMGGAYTALANDANALLYNPAGLGRIAQHEVTFMHSQHFEGIYQEYPAAGFRRGWGASVNYLNFSGVPRTTIANTEGTGMDSVGLSGLAFSGGYGRAWNEHLAVGAGLKFIRESVADVTAYGFGLDAGAMCGVPNVEGLTLGAAIQNFGPAVKFQSARENLPLNFRFGAGYEFELYGLGNTVSLDVSKERSESAVVGAGLESVVAGLVSARLGFTSRNDDGPGVTVGAGFIYRGSSFDYAFVPMGGLGMSHRISATLRWGPGGKPPKASRSKRRWNRELSEEEAVRVFQ